MGWDGTMGGPFRRRDRSSGAPETASGVDTITGQFVEATPLAAALRGSLERDGKMHSSGVASCVVWCRRVVLYRVCRVVSGRCWEMG